MCSAGLRAGGLDTAHVYKRKVIETWSALAIAFNPTTEHY